MPPRCYGNMHIPPNVMHNYMSTHNKKKCIEKRNFEIFSNLFFGRIIPFNQPNPPHPDISFIQGCKEIGCEITSLYWDNIPGETGSEYKRTEAFQDTICKKVEAWLHSELPVPFEVHIGFDYSIIEGKSVEEISQSVIQILKENISYVNTGELSFHVIEDDDRMPHPIYQIKIIYLPSLKKSVVCDGAASFIPKLGSDRIAEAIQNKEIKIKNYKSLYEEFWLLLCIEQGKLCSEFVMDEVIDFKVQTEFHRVFLLSPRSSKILELK